MEFKIDRDLFHKGLQRTQSAHSPRGVMPILANTLLEAKDGKVTIFCTNLEIGLRGSVDADVISPGSLTASARKLSEIAREAPRGASMLFKEDDDGRARLSVGASRFTLATLPAAEYPEPPQYDPSNSIALDGALLGELIRKSSYAISLDETRRALNGAYVELAGSSIKMVATDGHRLAYVERERGKKRGAAKDLKMILSRKAITELAKMAAEAEDSTIALIENDNHAIFEFDGQTLLAKLIDGVFPNYEQVIPKTFQKIATLDKDELTRLIKRVAIMADEKSKMIRFTFESDKLEARSEGGDLGDARDEMSAQYEGEPLSIGVNAAYLIEALDALDGSKIAIKLNDPLAPVLIETENDSGALAIVMPMRL